MNCTSCRKLIGGVGFVVTIVAMDGTTRTGSFCNHCMHAIAGNRSIQLIEKFIISRGWVQAPLPGA